MRLSGQRNLDVELDLSDRTKFTFPGNQDPREYGNLSHWMDALTLVTRLKDGNQDLSDPESIKKHSLFNDGKAGFSLRLTVLPIQMGQVSVWLSTDGLGLRHSRWTRTA